MRLQGFDNFTKSILSVAAFENSSSGRLHFNCTLRKQNHLLFAASAPAAPRSQLRPAGIDRPRHALRALDSECTRWRPTRLHVSEVQSIQLCPQNVALVAQCLNDGFLLAARVRVFKCVI